jgi:hypothetical protein
MVKIGLSPEKAPVAGNRIRSRKTAAGDWIQKPRWPQYSSVREICRKQVSVGKWASFQGMLCVPAARSMNHFGALIFISACFNA